MGTPTLAVTDKHAVLGGISNVVQVAAQTFYHVKIVQILTLEIFKSFVYHISSF